MDLLAKQIRIAEHTKNLNFQFDGQKKNDRSNFNEIDEIRQRLGFEEMLQFSNLKILKEHKIQEGDRMQQVEELNRDFSKYD